MAILGTLHQILHKIFLTDTIDDWFYLILLLCGEVSPPQNVLQPQNNFKTIDFLLRIMYPIETFN